MGPSTDKQKKRSLWQVLLTVAMTAVVLMTGCQAEDSNSNTAMNGGNSATASGVSRAESSSRGESMSDMKSSSLSNQNVAANEEVSAGESGEALAAGGAPALGAASGGEAFNGKIIYSASVRMRVEDVGATGTELRELIQASGGYILGFSDSRNNGDIGSVYTIKVPAQGFMSFVDRLEAMPNVEFQREISGKDVSEEYVDLESRLKARRLVEERLLTMMAKAVQADDLLRFSNQLGEIQEQIEQITGRIRYLDANVAYSTIELRVYQLDQKLASVYDEKEKSLGTRLVGTLTGSAEAVWKGIQYLLIFLVGALPVLAVLALVGIPIYLIFRYKKKQVATPDKTPDESDPLSNS